MISLESIIESGLTGDLPDENAGADELGNPSEDAVQEAVVEGVEVTTAVEGFLLWARISQERLDLLKRMSNESAYRSEEGEVLKKIGKGIKAAFEHIVRTFKNFIQKVANFFRSMGIKSKLEYIKSNASKVKAEHFKDNETKYSDAEYLIGLKKIVNDNLSAAFSNWFSSSPENIKKVDGWFGANGAKINEKTLDEFKAFESYTRNQTYELYDFFTRDFQKLLGGMNRLILNDKIQKNDITLLTDEDKVQCKAALSTVRSTYSAYLKAYSSWITLSKMCYKVCMSATSTPTADSTSDDKKKKVKSK